MQQLLSVYLKLPEEFTPDVKLVVGNRCEEAISD